MNEFASFDAPTLLEDKLSREVGFSMRGSATSSRSLTSLLHRLLPDIDEDSEGYRRARLLAAANFIMFFVGLGFAFIMWVIGQYSMTNILVLVFGSGLTALNLILLKVTRSTRLIGALFLLEILAVISYQAFTDHGLMDPPLLWNLVLPWLAAFFVGPVYGFIYGGLVVCVTIAFFVLEWTGYPFPRVSSPDVIWMFHLMVASSVAMFVGYLGWLYEGHTLGTLKEKNRKLSKAHEALRTSSERMVSIVESITSGFFALDQNWRFTYVNHKAEQLLGKKREDIIDRNAWEIFADTIPRRSLAAMRAAVRKDKAGKFEVNYLPQNRWLEIHTYPFSGGLSVYVTDITDRKEYEAKLVEAKERAEELTRLKSSILANMSHELRTPLTAIIGFADVLAGEVAAKDLEFVEFIRQSGRKLTDTLNSVLDLTRLDSGALNPVFNKVYLPTLVDKVVSYYTPMAESRGLTLRTKQDCPRIYVSTDLEFIDRILSNLVDNAVKFTEEGFIEIDVTEEADHVAIHVSDTGIGISEEFLPHIYEEFRQESIGLDRSYEGNGLGLAVTRRLVEALGGQIEVQSQKGVGTRFTVRLPLAQETENVEA